jgi:hypothetical protein
MNRVMGPISTTVVTLSRNADATAVMRQRTTRMRQGSTPARRIARIATHWKTPVRRRTLAITIIPRSRKMTLKSIAPNASSW